ncbi:unnamed protein product, partial [Symbiodinium microadriaticum]
MQASCIDLHRRSAIHRLAERCVASPDVSLAKLVAHEPVDEKLLAGSVPQLSDWLRAWRTVQSPVSFLKASRQSATESHIDCRRGYKRHVDRKPLKDMLEIILEVTREHKRYRCCRTTSDPYETDDLFPWLAGGHGILGVLKHHGKEACCEDLDEDYSQKIADSILQGVHRLATPLGGDPDVDVINRVKQTLTSYASDGGAPMKKCGKLLQWQRNFPNLCLILQDKAHNIRRASLPLTMEANFKKWWADTYESKTSIIPSLQNSHEWRQRFIVLQQKVLREAGDLAASASGGAAPAMNNLRRAVETLSFAKQRFDSFSSPQGKFICLVLPICLLLAAQACDERLDGRLRWRSEQQLKGISGESILLAGLSADFGAEILKFVRRWDGRDPDIASTLRHRDDFVARMRALFSEGRVLLDAASAGAMDEDEETFTVRGLRTAMSAAPIQYGEKLHSLWTATEKSKCTEVMQGMQTVVDATVARVQVDMDGSDLHMSFAIFDLPLWKKMKDQLEQGQVEAWESFQSSQKRRTGLLAKALHHQPQELWRELSAASAALLQDATAVAEAKSRNDSRPNWRRVLEGPLDGCMQLGVLRDAVCFYLSIQDGECGVERDLALLRDQLKNHEAALDRCGLTASCLLEIKLDGPQTEQHLAERLLPDAQPAAGLMDPFAVGDSAVLRMTPFTRRCAQLWLAKHGRRFRCYKERSDKGTRRAKRKGTMASVVRGQVRASDALVEMPAPRGDTPTAIPGMPLRSFAQRAATKLRGSSRWNPEFEKFQKLTESKSNLRSQERQRQFFGRPPPRPLLRKGKVFQTGPAPRLSSTTLVADLSSETRAPEATRQCAYKRCPGDISFEDMLRSNILVVDDAQALEQGRAGSSSQPTQLHWYLAVVAFGKGLVSIGNWLRADRMDLVRYYQAASKEVPAKVFVRAEFKQQYGK